MPLTTNQKSALPSLPYGTPLTGTGATLWAVAILDALGAPATGANVASLRGWFLREGGGGANNPMNTTLANVPGAAGSINSVGVQNYSTPADGVNATAVTLNGGYPAIVADLKAGNGLANPSPEAQAELSKWSGGGYTSITPSTPTGTIPQVNYGGPGGGRTRPGGEASSSSGGSGSQSQVEQILQSYTSLRSMPRTAPPGTKNPFNWWMASFTGNWDKLGGGVS